MTSTSTGGVRDLRYEPEERPPPALALGLGFQFAMLTVAGIVLTPAIVVRAAGGGEDFLSWAAFAALAIFADSLGAWGGLLGNGMTAGGLAAILMTLFLELSRRRPRRLRAALNSGAYPTIDAFLGEFAKGRGWSRAMSDRLRAVGEETLLTLIRRDEEATAGEERELQVTARNDGRAAELEFVAATEKANIEDRIALLGDRVTGAQIEQEISLRLLRHLASSVRHRQYHDTDVLTVRVEPPASA